MKDQTESSSDKVQLPGRLNTSSPSLHVWPSGRPANFENFEYNSTDIFARVFEELSSRLIWIREHPLPSLDGSKSTAESVSELYSAQLTFHLHDPSKRFSFDRPQTCDRQIGYLFRQISTFSEAISFYPDISHIFSTRYSAGQEGVSKLVSRICIPTLSPRTCFRMINTLSLGNSDSFSPVPIGPCARIITERNNPRNTLYTTAFLKPSDSDSLF